MNKVKLLSLSLIASAMLSSTPVFADSFLGANYHSGKNKVSFMSEQTRIAGNVFLPPNYNSEKRLYYPSVRSPSLG